MSRRKTKLIGWPAREKLSRLVGVIQAVGEPRSAVGRFQCFQVAYSVRAPVGLAVTDPLGNCLSQAVEDRLDRRVGLLSVRFLVHHLLNPESMGAVCGKRVSSGPWAYIVYKVMERLDWLQTPTLLCVDLFLRRRRGRRH